MQLCGHPNSLVQTCDQTPCKQQPLGFPYIPRGRHTIRLLERISGLFGGETLGCCLPQMWSREQDPKACIYWAHRARGAKESCPGVRAALIQGNFYPGFGRLMTFKFFSYLILHFGENYRDGSEKCDIDWHRAKMRAKEIPNFIFLYPLNSDWG